MTDKYELTDNTKECSGHTLYRIKALKDFGDVKKGYLGGWIESYDNLSQTGTAWVHGNAKVYDDARIYDSARVCGNAKVYDNAEVCGNAIIYENVRVYGNAQVYGNTIVGGNAKVYDNAWVYGNAQVYSKAKVYGNARVYGNTIVGANAKIYGDSEVNGDVYIRENDEINNDNSYLVFKNNWSSGRYFVYVLSNQRWHVGCFDGTSEELVKKAYADSEVKGKMYEMYVHFAEDIVETRQRN